MIECGPHPDRHPTDTQIDRLQAVAHGRHGPSPRHGIPEPQLSRPEIIGTVHSKALRTSSARVVSQALEMASGGKLGVPGLENSIAKEVFTILLSLSASPSRHEIWLSGEQGAFYRIDTVGTMDAAGTMYTIDMLGTIRAIDRIHTKRVSAVTVEKR